jgi:RHS repeat-associated protein
VTSGPTLLLPLLAALSSSAGDVRIASCPGHESNHCALGTAGSLKHVDSQEQVLGEEKYEYRKDGELVSAANGTCTVKLERDILGRVVREVVGEDSIESEYGPLGLRMRMRTSKGHVLDIERNVVGDVLALRAGGGPAVAPGSDVKHEAAPSWEARFTRNNLGLELERHLPGGVRSVWKRDKLGRPESHEIWSGRKQVGAKSYTWETNDRLKMIVDALHGPIRFNHDNLGNLNAAVYASGKMDLRMPDAVGNLFKTADRRDRKYGPAGQLLESLSKAGITRYTYDPEGNLVLKTLPDGSQWKYEWDAAGMLAKVLRPDGNEVTFGYDALGRRVWKKYQGKTTKWIWDGNVPVHEWVELDPGVAAEPAPEKVAEAEDAGLRQRAVDLAKRSSQGPPPSGPLAGGSADAPITWIFEPESFAPAARLSGDQQHAIIADHLGTPTAMLDNAGQPVWSADIGIYGELRNVTGEKAACPFRWPGQYEDEETGLYYNRFRYYDPESGEYVSQDPIGLEGGLQLAGYVRDPLTWLDPLGLAAACGTKKAVVIGRGMPRVQTAAKDLQAAGVNAKWYQTWKKNWPNRKLTPIEEKAALKRNERWIKEKIAQGYEFYTVGGMKNKGPSPFFDLENKLLKDAGITPIFLPGY